MPPRTTLALPVDVARAFDHTVTQTNLANNTFQSTDDDRGVLAGYIENAEQEFRQATNFDTRIGRQGIPGRPESYEKWTYKTKGHQAFKQNWTGAARDYTPQEVEKNLDFTRVVPIDPEEGDEVRIYRGLRGRSGQDQWEDITDQQGETWDIVNHRDGTLVLHPIALHRAMQRYSNGLGTGGELNQVRLALCYRYGGLDRSRSLLRTTSLAADLAQDDSTTVPVDDLAVFPSGVAAGPPILTVGDEHVRATVDRDNDELVIVERGVRGTEPAAHSSGDPITYVPPAVRKAVTARAVMAILRSGRYSEWLVDVDDDLSRDDLLAEYRDVYQGTVEAFDA